MCKPSKTCTGFLCWELQNADERNKEDQKNGDIYYVNQLEDSVQ